ncbi:MAG: class I SAM-dependent methyltransferase [Nanoarchaeota archaeon]|nr:class I SAM-dependent methyltransferase [Nanoarchaeota archaeon]MBU1004845.1 class I SAM-dependent methyltransferase [Nanoarchaeota archaeon]MBU1946783.1 class I SAM-dependent methyltransferase [Nanoarchaeota archaeon]
MLTIPSQVEGVDYHLDDVTLKYRVTYCFRGVLPRLEEGSEILDLGCNRGITTKHLGRLYPHCRVIGVEILPGYLTEEAEGNVDFIVGDAFTDLERRTFDMVIAMNNIYFMLIHHPLEVQKKALTKIMRDLKRLTRPRGYLLIAGQQGNAEFIERGLMYRCIVQMDGNNSWTLRREDVLIEKAFEFSDALKTAIDALKN